MAVLNNSRQVIAHETYYLLLHFFLFRARARVNTRTHATSNLCEHAGEPAGVSVHRHNQYYCVIRADVKF